MASGETKQILVVYGSETGNAYALAELLTARLDRFSNVKCKLRCINDLGEPTDLSKMEMVIFICSTTGQGELPRNTKNFWRKLLRKKLSEKLLENLHFSAFGLGDSSYPRYQWAIRKIHKRLLQLGAKEFFARGEGDEMSPDGVDAMFEHWANLLIEKLAAEWDVGEETDLKTLMAPRHKLVIKCDLEKVSNTPRRIYSTESDENEPNKGTISSNSRMTAKDHFQDVRYFALNDSSQKLVYEPGDVVALYPENDPEDVEALLTAQGWSDIADFPCYIEDTDGDIYHFENGSASSLTLRSLLTFNLDIMSIPKRTFFSLAWHFSENHEREREKLLELSTLEGLEDLHDYANRPRRSILEVIAEFGSLKIPTEYLLDLIPPIRPRLFSIASRENAQTIELSIAIVKYKTIIRRIRRGLCSSWIERLKVGENVPYKIIQNGLANTNKKIDIYQDPILMVAPGTGVAPMRSLILTRSRNGNDEPMVLFFGSRYEKKDNLFSQDWKNPIESGDLKVVNAFSREGGGYVQTKLAQHGKLVHDMLIKQNAILYVCGSSGAMPRQVRITIIEILKETVEKWDEKDAEAYVSLMEKNGRYLQETW